MKVKKIAVSNRMEALRSLVERLREVGYGPAALRESLGVGFPDDVGLLNRAPAWERLRALGTPLGTAVRLFFLESSERPAAMRRLLSPAAHAVLRRAGLLAAQAGGSCARLRIDVYGPLYLLADRRFASPDRGALGLPAGDMVYPPGSDSVMLADAVPARDGERVLDLCTGSGIQAIAVAARARAVLAVDVGARAAAVATINAAMNDAAVEVRVGDLFAPVRGERFDLILANPPFVPGPQRGPAYHSGGPRGDRVLRRVITGLPRHLRDGGRAVVISHIALRAGQDVADVVRPWFANFAGRALVLVLETGTPVDLAAAQALFALDDGFAAYGAEVRRWIAYLERHRVAQVAALLIVAERSGPAEVEVVEAFQRTLPLPLSQPPRALLETWLRRA